jgi:glycine/D-amino acid oxidase-like deaminating enzyme
MAHRLAPSGLNVTLPERDAIAAHASGRNAGSLNPLRETAPALILFALEAFRIHKEIRAELAQRGCANYVPLPASRVHPADAERDRRRWEEIATLFNTTESSSVRLDWDDLWANRARAML